MYNGNNYTVCILYILQKRPWQAWRRAGSSSHEATTATRAPKLTRQQMQRCTGVVSRLHALGIQLRPCLVAQSTGAVTGARRRRHHVLTGDGAMSIGARDDGTMLGCGTGKEEQGCSHCGGVPTFTGGGNGLVATDSSTPSSGTINLSSFDSNRGCTGSSPISPHL